MVGEGSACRPIIGTPGHLRTLDDSFVASLYVYPSLTFCIGVVLLFSKERGRRRGRLDWTRRWGVVCSYAVLLLSAAPEVLFVAALVLGGIAALFLCMPLEQQPAVTQSFINVSSAYLRYGPYPYDLAIVLRSRSRRSRCCWPASRCSTPFAAAGRVAPRDPARPARAVLALVYLGHVAGGIA